MTLVGFVGGQQFTSLISLLRTDYTPPAWHSTLFTMGVAIFSVLCNIFLVRKLNVLEGLMFLVHIAGFFFIFVILWIMGPRSEPRDVFMEFSNDNAWPSVGLACLAGIVSPVVTLIGTDSSCHLAEEMRNASWAVPRAMFLTATISYTLGLAMVITLMFNISDLDTVLNTTTGQSYIAVIQIATESDTVTIFCTALVAFMMCSCGINQVTTSSRILYVFARDGAVPFGTWMSYVRPGWDFPLNAVLATLICVFLTSLFILASSTAFSTVTSLSLVGLISSYLIAIAVFLWRKLQPEPLPLGKFALGRTVGLVTNVVAIVFLAVVGVVSFFPAAPDPTPPSMNWSIVVMGTFLIVLPVYYRFYARHHYISPLERLKKLE